MKAKGACEGSGQKRQRNQRHMHIGATELSPAEVGGKLHPGHSLKHPLNAQEGNHSIREADDDDGPEHPAHDEGVDACDTLAVLPEGHAPAALHHQHGDERQQHIKSSLPHRSRRS
ncbi:hypothetical protein V6L77_08640 [Pannonibacter sp. Pt2-lr]